MILKARTTDSDGNLINPIDDWNLYVTNRAGASALIASELSSTATDDFLHDALTQWFTTGKISNLKEAENTFWHVELDETNEVE